MLKILSGVMPTLFLLCVQISHSNAATLVDCEKVQCLSPMDAALEKQKQSQAFLVSQNANVKTSSNNSTKAKSDSRATGAGVQGAGKVLNRDSMTLQEQQAYFSKSPWSFVASAGIYRTLDELSDYYSTYTMSGNYQIKRGFFVDFSLGVDSIFYSEDGNIGFGNQSADPRKYGLSDLTVGISRPGYMMLNTINSIVSVGTRLTLPTSMASRDRSMYATLTTYAQMRSRLTPKLMSSVTTSLILAAHEYDDADVFGYQVNSPVGLSYNVSLSYNFWKRMSVYSGYGLYHRYDYDDNLDTIQTFSAGILLPATDKLYLNFSYMWRDRVITNDRTFENTKSYYSLGLSYSI